MSRPRSIRTHSWADVRLGALFLALFAAWTATCPTVADNGPTVLTRPTGLKVNAQVGSLEVSVDWDDVAGAADYLVHWREYGPGNPLNDGKRVEASDTAITVEDYGDWVVQLRACNEAGCGQHLGRRFQVEPVSKPTPQPTQELTPTPTHEPAQESETLQVSITARPASPLIGHPVTLTAVISNAPSGATPSYNWQSDIGGWWTVGRNPTFSTLTANTESQNFRLTVTYGSGVSATSNPITVTWVDAIEEPTSEPIMLFDLENDLSENNDVAAQNPDIVEKIAGLMQSARTPSDVFLNE